MTAKDAGAHQQRWELAQGGFALIIGASPITPNLNGDMMDMAGWRSQTEGA